MLEKNNKDFEQEDALSADLRNGVWIFFLLLIFTAGEFIAALVSPRLGWLLLLAALPKAYFVVTDYMHIGELFAGKEEEE